MKRAITFALALLLAFNAGPVSGQGPAQRELIGETRVKRGRNEAGVALIRLGPEKLAALVRTPLRAKAKVQKMELISPSGKRYKSSNTDQVPSRQLGQYFDQISSVGRIFGDFCKRVDSILTREACADGGCPSSGGTGGGQEPCHEDRVSDRERAERFAAFTALIGRAMMDKDQWFTVLLYDKITIEPGSWEIHLVMVDDRGKRVRVTGTLEVIGPAEGEEIDPMLLRYMTDYDKYSRRLQQIAPDSYEAQTIRRILPGLEDSIRSMGGEVPEIPQPPVEPVPEVDMPAGGAQPPAGGRDLPWAESTNRATGITTRSEANPDGSHTITRTDKNGNVISRETTPPPRARGPQAGAPPGAAQPGAQPGAPAGQPAAPAGRQDRPWAEGYDHPREGVTTRSEGQADGSHSITQTDDQTGRVIQRRTTPPAGTAPPSGRSSYTDPETGVTTTIDRTGAGTRTTQTDRSGRVISDKLDI